MQNEIFYFVTIDIPENTIVDGYSEMVPFYSRYFNELNVAKDLFRNAIKVAAAMNMRDAYIRLWESDSDGDFVLEDVTIC